MPKFVLEQIAIVPNDRAKAIELLKAIGLTEWANDLVVANGDVFGVKDCTNVADLAFNYQTADGASGLRSDKPLEFEVLDYRTGENWMQGREGSASHLGMHCTEVELHDWRRFFTARGIRVHAVKCAAELLPLHDFLCKRFEAMVSLLAESGVGASG